MKLYDALLQEEKQINKSEVCIYSCGPTVYSDIHIGNARPLILVDLIIRFLKYKNVKYKYLLNITDIDDKIIQKAIELNISEQELTKKTIESFKNDLENLNLLKDEIKIIPISKKISEIISFISKLIEQGNAYEVDGNVYFDVNKWEAEYGKLSKQNLSDLEVGNRIEHDSNKRSSHDFVLWKKTEVGKKWLSKWGYGRPGWHTECALLIDNEFNKKIDIHVGGIDLKFPHHENERIQFIAKNGFELSDCWIYNGHLSVKDEKMSKSLNNIVSVREFLNNYSANVLKIIFFNSNYKQPINISNDVINSAIDWDNKVFNLLKTINWKLQLKSIELTKKIPIDEDFNSYKYMTRFKSYMENDLNTPMVITLIDEMIKNINKQIKQNSIDLTYQKLLTILDILGLKFNLKKLDSDIISKLNEWQLAIKEKNFEKADLIRDLLKKEDII